MFLLLRWNAKDSVEILCVLFVYVVNAAQCWNANDSLEILFFIRVFLMQLTFLLRLILFVSFYLFIFFAARFSFALGH